MNRFIAGFVVAVFLIGAVAQGNPVIDVSVSTDQASYLPQEPIEMFVTATNPNDSDITLHFNSGYQAGYIIDGTYNPAAYWLYTQAFTSVYIEAHQSHTWTFDYDWGDHFLSPGTHSLTSYVKDYALSPLIEFKIIPEPGDFDLDNDVDVCDLGILATNYNTTTGMTWWNGDADDDGDVDVEDLGILSAHYGHGTDTASAVPEPGTMTLVCIGVLTLVLRHRKR